MSDYLRRIPNQKEIDGLLHSTGSCSVGSVLLFTHALPLKPDVVIQGVRCGSSNKTTVDFSSTKMKVAGECS